MHSTRLLGDSTSVHVRKHSLVRASPSDVPAASNGVPPKTTTASNAASKLEMLRQLQARTAAMVQQSRNMRASGNPVVPSPFTSGGADKTVVVGSPSGSLAEPASPHLSAPGLVDSRMYAASMEGQRRLSEKLSQANMTLDVLQEKIMDYEEGLDAANTLIKKVAREFGTTGRLAEAAVASVQFGVDREDAIQKIKELQKRLELLEQALQKERDEFSKRVPQKVPLTWVGSASEVKLLGSFDNWTLGVELSMPDADVGDSYDDVLRTFVGTAHLLPGRYRVKFMVDGEWRLAPDWPMEANEEGETNNILEVL